MTKREREYHYEKKVWKSFIKLSSEPGGASFFYDPSLKSSLDWEPQPIFDIKPNRSNQSLIEYFEPKYAGVEIKGYYEDEFPKWSEPNL